MAAPPGGRLIGLAAAVAAVALWTWYALANARFLAARPGIAAGSWSSVVGLATLAVTLAALLPVTLLGHTSWSAVSRRDAAMFLAGTALLGVAVSWGGTWLWNTASARLPTTTAGLLVNVETVSGYLYVYLARHQWPPPGQILGFALILAGVSLALTRRQMPGPTRQHRPPDRKPGPPDGLIPGPQKDPAAGLASHGAHGTGSSLLRNTSAWHRDQREAGGTAPRGQTITSLLTRPPRPG